MLRNIVLSCLRALAASKQTAGAAIKVSVVGGTTGRAGWMAEICKRNRRAREAASGQRSLPDARRCPKKPPVKAGGFSNFPAILNDRCGWTVVVAFAKPRALGGISAVAIRAHSSVGRAADS